LVDFFGSRSEKGVSNLKRDSGGTKQTLVNVWQDTTLRNCNMPQKLVQLLIVADGKLEVTRDDTGLLVVTGGVASKFEDFGRKVLEHGCEVDGGTSTNTLGVVALSQETVDTADGECETGF
jgi:hypothetical protein